MFDKTLYEQFKTNQQERLGILSLTGCVVIIIFVTYFFLDSNSTPQPINPELREVLDKYYENKKIETVYENEEVNAKFAKEKKHAKSKSKKTAQLFYFDPNKIDKQGFVNLGFSSNQSSTIINFRESGATFKQPRDLFKVYNIDTSLVLKLAQYMLFEKAENSTITKDSLKYKTRKVETLKPRYDLKIIEVNSATHEELISIYGIGDVFADIIIKYRGRLGGYINLSQISEAYEFSDSTLQIFERSITIDTSLIQKLNINEVTFKELLAHPYITYELNKILYPFVESRRPITDLDIIHDVMLIDSATINKLKPYLTIQ